jgi:hypothetical protein
MPKVTWSKKERKKERKTAISVCKDTQFCQVKGISISYTDEECQDVRHATATISTLTAIPDHHLITLLKYTECYISAHSYLQQAL